MSWSIVTSTDVDPAVNRTTVPTIWSAPPSGVPDEGAGGVDGTADAGGVDVGTDALGADGTAADRGVDVDVGAQATKIAASMIAFSHFFLIMRWPHHLRRALTGHETCPGAAQPENS